MKHWHKKKVKQNCNDPAIQTLNGHLWLNVGRDLYAKLTSAHMEHELTTTAGA